MKMTKREMMIKAHRLARRMVGDYRARLALALRQVWDEVKNRVDLCIGESWIILNLRTREVTGNTYPVKDVLRRRFCCKWNNAHKAWVVPQNTAEEKDII